jgi:hypothetical protein
MTLRAIASITLSSPPLAQGDRTCGTQKRTFSYSEARFDPALFRVFRAAQAFENQRQASAAQLLRPRGVAGDGFIGAAAQSARRRARLANAAEMAERRGK